MNRSIRDIKKFVFKKKVYIILITLIFIITGVFYSLTNTEYVSKQKLLIGKEDTNLIDTYKEFVTSSSVIEQVKTNLNLDMNVNDIASMIETSKVDNTNMIEIKVVGVDSEFVNLIADEVGKVFITTVDSIYGNTEIYKVDTISSYYRTGNIVLIGVCSGIVGFVLSTLIFVFFFMFNTKVRTSNDIEEITTLKPLILIPNQKSMKKKKLFLDAILSQKSKIFKTLMTNIQFVNTNNLRSKSILITSPEESDGKTYIALNLAVEFAKVGKKVIVIDADMRKGTIAKIFNLPRDFGFSNYLSNLDPDGNYINERITKFINDTEIKNLNVITSGMMPPNPAELLKEDKINELIKDLKVFYDVIIFDTVQVLGAGEAKKLAKSCDLTLMISRYNKTERENLLIAYDQLNYFEGACIGVGLNRVPEKRVRRKIDIKANIKKIIKTGIENFKDLLKVVGRKIIKFVGLIKVKSNDVKEFIQTHRLRKEEIKLIEAAQNPVNNNVVEKVFDAEVKKEEALKEVIKPEINDIPKKEVVQVVQPKVENITPKEEAKPENAQLKIDDIAKSEKQEVKIKNTVNEKKPQVKINEMPKVEVPQAKVNKTNKVSENAKPQVSGAAKVEKAQPKANNVTKKSPVKPPVITEEMVRRQVEMDEMIRIAKEEEENEKKEKQRIKTDKRIDFYKNTKSKFTNFISKYQLSDAEKLKRKKEKFDKKVQKIKTKEEKRKAKELQKQKEREQMRISIEIHDDNIYPRPKM